MSVMPRMEGPLYYVHVFSKVKLKVYNFITLVQDFLEIEIKFMLLNFKELFCCS